MAAHDNVTKPNPKPKKAKAASTWTDPATSLMWTMRDNGSNVNWSEATLYCQTLSLGGRAVWRLPNIDELQGIYDQRTTSMTRSGEHGRRVVPSHTGLVKARSAYQDFFALWKHADPDIPILRQAKAEYSKLR
jgi:hypothetical protein